MAKKLIVFLLCVIILFPSLSVGKTWENEDMEKYSELIKKNIAFPQQMEIFFVISAGSGLHFAFPPSLAGSTLLKIHFSFIPSVIYCSYTGDEASTDIIPLLSPENATTISGSHKILLIGFMGVLGWDGVFSFSDAGFAGFAFYVWTS